MEAIGLAIGFVGLVNDCIEFFALFSTVRSFGRDYEILDAKLHIEKTVFLQWVEGVGLLYPEYDSRLDDPQIMGAVSRIIKGLKVLLGESETLQTRYGLQAVAAESNLSGNTFEDSALTSLARRRQGRFISALKAFKSRHDDRNLRVPSAKKIRWAVVDKVKFKDLVDEVMYFTSRLRHLVPLKQEMTTRMVAEDVNSLSKVQHLQLAFDAAVGYEDGIAEAAKLAIPQRRILRQLWFRVMDERRHAVKLHHYRTLEWSLREENRRLEWTNLPGWLKSGLGVYWLSGKAGSGKSTLMKFLLSDEKTREYLFMWGGDSLVMESFFFWHLGHEKQKTIEGLRQALLYKILEAEPQLTQSLLPAMWQEVCILDDDPRDLPSAGEIDNAFHVLVRENAMQKRFCFFIDGLDEYSGNPMDAINLLELLVSSPNIKIVASSRPIPACVSAFLDNPQLRLQELNRTDIEAYVQDKVWSHRQIPVLLGQDGERMTSILEELVDKSSGVFLWVILACMSILEGIANFDTISELERRVQELPKELEDLFHDMIMRTDPRYRDEGAQLLWMCYWSQRCSWKIPSIGLALAGNLEMKLNALDSSEAFIPKGRRQMVLAAEGRIRSRCSGLLEIAARPIGLDNNCFCGAENDILVSYSHDRVVDSEITVIHRSVFEFLEEVTINGQDCSSSQSQSFAMLAYIALRLIAIARYDEHQSLADTYLGKFLQFANNPDFATYPGAIVPLRILANFVRRQIARNSTDTRRVKNPSIIQRVIRHYRLCVDDAHAMSILHMAIEGGCLQLAHLLAEENGEVFEKLLKKSYALQLALVRPKIGALLSLKPSLAMICFLIDSGCSADGAIRDHDGSSKHVSEVWARIFKAHFESIEQEDPMVLQVAKYFSRDLDSKQAIVLPRVSEISETASTIDGGSIPSALISREPSIAPLISPKPSIAPIISPEPSMAPQEEYTEYCTVNHGVRVSSRIACGIPYILHRYFMQVYERVASWISS